MYAADKVSKVRELRTRLAGGLDAAEAAVRRCRYQKSLEMLEQARPSRACHRNRLDQPVGSLDSAPWTAGRDEIVGDDLTDRLAAFRGVTLAQLDERAALLRRVDRKYAVELGRFLELLEELRDDHVVLEIDGERCFAYRSVYFDTPDRRCFWDHVHGRVPRFKARTRLYRDTGSCVFEVKLKRTNEELDKRQTEHPAERNEELTEAAAQCLGEALSDAGLRAPAELAQSLQTSFRRITLAASGSSERLTCDLDVRLSSPEGKTAKLAGSLVLVETKTERGEGRADQAVAETGVEEVSLSKYRVGMSLVGNASTDDAQPGSELFAGT